MQSSLINTLEGIKKQFEENNTKEKLKLNKEEYKNNKYFYDPGISILSVVNEEKDIIKFNKIINYIIERVNTSYYSIYNTALTLFGLFILFLLVGSSNAVNITDGLDGLCAGLCVIAFLAFGIFLLTAVHPCFIMQLG